MLTLGFLALSVGLIPLVILFAMGRLRTLEVAFVRLGSWWQRSCYRRWRGVQ